MTTLTQCTLDLIIFLRRWSARVVSKAKTTKRQVGISYMWCAICCFTSLWCKKRIKYFICDFLCFSGQHVHLVHLTESASSNVTAVRQVCICWFQPRCLYVFSFLFFIEEFHIFHIFVRWRRQMTTDDRGLARGSCSCQHQARRGHHGPGGNAVNTEDRLG